MLVSSAEETAKDVYATLAPRTCCARGRRPNPPHEFLTTGDPEQFRRSPSASSARARRRRRGARLEPVEGRRGADGPRLRAGPGRTPGTRDQRLPRPARRASTCGWTRAREPSRTSSTTSSSRDIDAIADHPRAPRPLRRPVSRASTRWHYGELGTPGPARVRPDRLHAEARRRRLDRLRRSRCARRSRSPRSTPGEAFEVGPFRVKTEPMAHLGLPALGFRIEADGTVLAYTGDTGPTTTSRTLARDADLLLAEATWQDRDDLLPFHLSARQAAMHAREAGCGRLVLTHIWPTLDREVSQAQAAEDVRGPDRRRRRGHARSRSARERPRPDGRRPDELRPIEYRARLPGVGRGVGAVLDGPDAGPGRGLGAEDAPRWLRGTGEGWVTGRVLDAARARRPSAPRARCSTGRPSGRTQEIQRLIGRSLRAVTDSSKHRRAHDHDRLRRAAGRRRDAVRVDHGRVHRAGARGARA